MYVNKNHPQPVKSISSLKIKDSAGAAQERRDFSASNPGFGFELRERLFYFRLFYEHLDSGHELDQRSRSWLF